MNPQVIVSAVSQIYWLLKNAVDFEIRSCSQTEMTRRRLASSSGSHFDGIFLYMLLPNTMMIGQQPVRSNSNTAFSISLWNVLITGSAPWDRSTAQSRHGRMILLRVFREQMKPCFGRSRSDMLPNISIIRQIPTRHPYDT